MAEEHCSICFNEICVETHELECGHCFHTACLENMIGNRCPMCRTKTSFTKLHFT